MNRLQFKERITQSPLLLDGAMGTMLHSRGVALDHCFDALNLEQPALVADIHRSYIEAGADMIETNSFGANSFKLAEHGFEKQVVEINRAAVLVAHRAVESSFRPVLVAGSVGPLGVRLAPLGRVSEVQAQAVFGEQIGALLRPGTNFAGVDCLILETMTDFSEIEAAVSATRGLSADIPIIAQMTFTRDDRTVLGYSPVDVACKLAQLDLDMIGVNCSGGPAQVLRILAMMHQAAPDMPLSAVPNAGWPERMEGGRVLYPATPAYFGEYARSFLAAGASLIGGCCGTNPSHIAAMRQTIDRPGRVIHPVPPITLISREEGPTATVEPPTHLAQAFANRQFIITVEMRPPKGITTQRLLAGARMLKAAGANFLNLADTPVARMRMSAWAAAYLTQKEIGLETILHFPTRGRNLLRIQGDLLAAHALGIRNLFVVMGDPTHIGDYPEAMDNYDIVPTGLIQLIKSRLNSGLEQSGKAIDQPTNFSVGCALNLETKEPENELKLLRKKIRNGADFALSQPVFNPEIALAFLERCNQTFGGEMIPVLVGIQPLYNFNNTEFLHNEIPGITIPDSYRERMKAAVQPQQEGIAIAQEILLGIRPAVHGVYFIPQFGRYDLVAELVETVSK